MRYIKESEVEQSSICDSCQSYIYFKKTETKKCYAFIDYKRLVSIEYIICPCCGTPLIVENNSEVVDAEMVDPGLIIYFKNQGRFNESIQEIQRIEKFLESQQPKEAESQNEDTKLSDEELILDRKNAYHFSKINKKWLSKILVDIISMDKLRISNALNSENYPILEKLLYQLFE